MWKLWVNILPHIKNIYLHEIENVKWDILTRDKVMITCIESCLDKGGGGTACLLNYSSAQTCVMASWRLR